MSLSDGRATWEGDSQRRDDRPITFNCFSFFHLNISFSSNDSLRHLLLGHQGEYILSFHRCAEDSAYLASTVLAAKKMCFQIRAPIRFCIKMIVKRVNIIVRHPHLLFGGRIEYVPSIHHCAKDAAIIFLNRHQFEKKILTNSLLQDARTNIVQLPEQSLLWALFTIENSSIGRGRLISLGFYISKMCSRRTLIIIREICSVTIAEDIRLCFFQIVNYLHPNIYT